MFFQERLKEVSERVFSEDTGIDLINVLFSDREVFLDFIRDLEFRLNFYERTGYGRTGGGRVLEYERRRGGVSFSSETFKRNLENFRKILEDVAGSDLYAYFETLSEEEREVFLKATLRFLKVRLLLLLREWKLGSFFYFLAYFLKSTESRDTEKYGRLEEKAVTISVDTESPGSSMGAAFDYFDNCVKLYCRSFWANLGKNVLLFFISHELGHYYFTFLDVLEKMRKSEGISDKRTLLKKYVEVLNEKIDDSLFPLVNLFEDVRVEKKIADASKNVGSVFRQCKSDLFDLIVLSRVKKLKRVVEAAGEIDRLSFFNFISFFFRFYANPQVYGFTDSKEVELKIKFCLKEEGIFDAYERFLREENNRKFLSDGIETAIKVSKSNDFLEVVEVVREFRNRWFPRAEELEKLESFGFEVSGKDLKDVIKELEEKLSGKGNGEGKAEKGEEEKEKGEGKGSESKEKGEKEEKRSSVDDYVESELEKEIEESFSSEETERLEEMARKEEKIGEEVSERISDYRLEKWVGEKNSLKDKAEKVLCSLEEARLFFDDRMVVDEEKLNSLFKSYQNGYNFMKNEMKRFQSGKLINWKEVFEIDDVGVRVDFREYVKRMADKRVAGKSDRSFLRNVYLINTECFPLKRIHFVVDTSGSMRRVEEKTRDLMAFIMGISDAITEAFKGTFGIDVYLIRGEGKKHYLFDFRLLTGGKSSYGLYSVCVLPRIKFTASVEGFSSYCYEKILSARESVSSLPDVVFVMTDGEFVSEKDWEAIREVKESGKNVGTCGLYFKETWGRYVQENFEEAFDGYFMADEKHLKTFFGEVLKVIYGDSRRKRLGVEDLRRIVNLVRIKTQPQESEVEEVISI